MCLWQEKLAGLRGSRLIVRGTRDKRSYYQQCDIISSKTQQSIQLQASLALVKGNRSINRLTTTNFLWLTLPEGTHNQQYMRFRHIQQSS